MSRGPQAAAADARDAGPEHQRRRGGDQRARAHGPARRRRARRLRRGRVLRWWSLHRTPLYVTSSHVTPLYVTPFYNALICNAHTYIII